MNIFIDPPTEQESSHNAAPIFTPRETKQLRERMPTIPQLAIALGGLVLVFGISYIPGFIDRRAPEREPNVREALGSEPMPLPIDHFEEVALSARAAYVWDVREQKALYNKNAGEQLPLASLTKLMTALVVYDALDPNDTVPITFDAIMQEGESYFSLGSNFTVQDLVDLTLVSSSNDGAYALAQAAGSTMAFDTPVDAFVDAMNAKAQSLGLSQSYFSNPTGLDVSTSTSGGYGSARDMAFLMEYILQHESQVLASTRDSTNYYADQMGAVFTATNTNSMVRTIPGIIGSKTGYTDLAGGNLVVAFDAGLNRPIIISVLGSTVNGRFSDVQTLIERTQRALAQQ